MSLPAHVFGEAHVLQPSILALDRRLVFSVREGLALLNAFLTLEESLESNRLQVEPNALANPALRDT